LDGAFPYREFKRTGNETTAGVRSTFLIFMLALSSLRVSERLMVIEKSIDFINVTFFLL
jgi:hypothetical protein